MTARTPPFVIQAGSHPAEHFREMSMIAAGSPFGAFAGGVSAFDPGHGIGHTLDLVTTQNGTPAMNVLVSGGGCQIRGTENQNQGVYTGYNDASVLLTIAAADPTNPRRDLVVAKVRDAAYSGAANDFSLAVVTGTPAGSPVDPAVPNNALVLARVTVAALASSIVNANITDLRTKSRGSAWNMPWGEIAATISTSLSQSGLSAVTDVTGMTVTWTAVANRRYRISGQVNMGSTVLTDQISLVLADGSNTQLDRIDVEGVGTPTVLFRDVGLSGSTTRKLRVVRTAGTGTITTAATATVPAELIVDDVGPA